MRVPFGRFLATVAAIGFFAVTPALADDKATDQAIANLLGDPARYRDVVEALQAAVKAHDAAGVARLVSYPIQVTIHGKTVRIADPSQFVANYDAIVTPAIASAVENQSYGDLFVNWQGIMFGRGEVWINGICHDEACNSFDARIVTIQPTTPEAASAAPVAEAGELLGYKDWTLGCDNARSCVALGMTPEDSTLSAYLRIARDGAADASPVVSFVVYPPDGAVAPLQQPSVRLTLDAHKAGGLPRAALPVEMDGDLYRVALADAAVPDLLVALRSANRIIVELQDQGRTVSTQSISLAGSTAALLKMDDLQKRVGTVTALVKKGGAPADRIPPVPALPVVSSFAVAELGDPLPAPPHGLASPSEDCSEGVPAHVAYDLGEGGQLWGSCASIGAYNFAYAFQIAVDGAVRPWTATVPGVTSDNPSWLWNAHVARSSQTLNSYFKGRGLADCGDATEWAYEGSGKFAPLRYRAMDKCRGVRQEDWPVLYRASRR